MRGAVIEAVLQDTEHHHLLEKHPALFHLVKSVLKTLLTSGPQHTLDICIGH